MIMDKKKNDETRPKGLKELMTPLMRSSTDLMTPAKTEPQQNVVAREGHFEMRVYARAELDKTQCQIVATELSIAFPDLDPGFFGLLIMSAERAGMGNDQLIEAVRHTINTCEYPRPTIARILNFNPKVRLYNHTQYCDNPINKTAVVVNGGTYWADLADIKRYNLTLKNPQQND